MACPMPGRTLHPSPPRVHTNVIVLRIEREEGEHVDGMAFAVREHSACVLSLVRELGPLETGAHREAGISLSTANSACVVCLTPLDNNYTLTFSEEQKGPLKSTCGNNKLMSYEPIQSRVLGPMIL